MALLLGHHVHAPVHAVDKIDVRVARRAEHHPGAGREAARGVRREVVWPEIGLGFDDAPDPCLAGDDVNQVLAEEILGNDGRIAVEE